MGTVVLAHHKPPGEVGGSLIESLAKRVSSVTRTEIMTATFEMLGERLSLINSCNHGFILTLARGGHYSGAMATLSSTCSHVHGPIPPLIPALHISSILAQWEQCPSVLSYHAARRYRELQRADYNQVEGLANSLLASAGSDCRIRLVPNTRCAENKCPRVGLYPVRDGIGLLGGEPGFSLLVYWIASTLR